MALKAWVWAVMVEQQQQPSSLRHKGRGLARRAGARIVGGWSAHSEEPVRHVGGGARLFVLRALTKTRRQGARPVPGRRLIWMAPWCRVFVRPGGRKRGRVL